MSDTTVVRIEFPPALMTREVAAYYLSTSVREIDRMRGRGDITAIGDGKRPRFRRSDLDAYIDTLPERIPGLPPYGPR